MELGDVQNNADNVELGERGKVSKCSHKKNMISLTSDPMLGLIVSQLSFDTWPPPSVM